MADDTENVTVEILRSIRDGVAETNQRVAETNERIDALRVETNQRINETNRRLDFLAEGQVRLTTQVADLTQVVRQNGERFDHFLQTEGESIRDLKARMTRVENHLGLGD